MKTTAPTPSLSGATPRFVRLQSSVLELRHDELARALGRATKAIIVNTPDNPTRQRCFTAPRRARSHPPTSASSWNAFRHHRRNLRAHPLRAARVYSQWPSLEGMRERAITINGNVQDLQRPPDGRSVGPSPPPRPLEAIRKVHDFLTVGAAAPLSGGGRVRPGAAGELLHAPGRKLSRQAGPHARILGQAGFECFKPCGAYLRHDRHLALRIFR